MRWLDKAQIDYADMYMRLYVAYNAWYRRVTGQDNDALALERLGSRFVIWDDYLQKLTLTDLRPLIRTIAEVSPLITHENDWKGLISYWYRVRCDIFHGLEVSAGDSELAYRSLHCFMLEIRKRMESCFQDKDRQRLEEITTLLQHGWGDSTRLKAEQEYLQNKYMYSSDIWAVDMIRVSTAIPAETSLQLSKNSV